MSYIKTINGSLLDATEDYIIHQCNCISTNAKALAESLFNKYPYANTYKYRTKYTCSIPGTISVMGNGQNERYIINMYSQYYPALPKYNNDNTEKRIEWFKECLNKISSIENIINKTIAMPYNIGCGAAGGDWNVYYNLIKEWCENNKIYVTLYKLNLDN
jgi:O-acetyl-ADP-ribose deacetylase (regulator of RNase III)